jgi:transposase
MMTMWPRFGCAVPAGTARVARAVFPKGCLAIRIRDALGALFEDTQFTGLFAVRGRPAVSPARLALVLVLQFAGGLSDRQAADAVRGRIDWKYALGLELTDTGFDASVLSEFRTRLLTHDQAERLLHQMLERLRAQGLLVRGGRQRTDATCVVAAVRELNRLELVTETMRAALEALAAAAPEWLVALAPTDWYQRYGQRASDYRLPQAKAARAALAVTVGADGLALLDAVRAADAPGWLRQVPAVQTLRAVSGSSSTTATGKGLRWRGKGEVPPAALAIDSRYDTDARYAVKRGAGWRGYKAHFTETCEHLVDRVLCQRGRCAGRPRRPWCRAGRPAAARLRLAGPRRGRLRPHPVRHRLGPQAGHLPQRQDRPQLAPGHQPPRAADRAGHLPHRPLHPLPRPGPLHPRAHQPPPSHLPAPPAIRDPAQHPRRAGHPGLAEPLRPPLRDRGHHRAGSHRGDVHRTRYRGLPKTHLQHVLTALALNLVRVDAWLTGTPLGGSWTSRLSWSFAVQPLVAAQAACTWRISAMVGVQG